MSEQSFARISSIDGASSSIAGFAAVHAGGVAPVRPPARARGWAVLAVLCIVAVSATLTVTAMRTTSTTFDEILLPAAGARGLETGRFDLIVEQPPVMEYLYGLPVWLAHPAYPPEQGRVWHVGDRYEYARDLFWRNGNDPERLAFLSRLVAAVVAAVLVLSVAWATAARFGSGAGVLAALLAAFLPDVLAHGGVAWNDLPEALALFWAVWAVDRAVRRPGVGRGALAGVFAGLALGVKFSAVALAPIAVGLAVAEGVGRRWDRRWLRGVLLSADVALAVAYVVLVLIYRGDFTLTSFRLGLLFQVGHAAVGSTSPVSFLGQRGTTGWWYFFPVAFLLKTPIALHALLGVAVASLFAAAASERGRALLRAPLRAEVVALAVLSALLLRADLQIGFRYAMPVLPYLLVIVAAGVARAWSMAGRPARAVLATACVAYIASSLSFYPDFLAYTSEYVARDRAHGLIVDSSLDWGQGLLRLRDFLETERVDSVYLAYFGSALPDGYGIDALPVTGVMDAATNADSAVARSPFFVVSATFLAGAYLDRDPFGPLRAVRPVKVLGQSLVVYRTRDAVSALRPPAGRPGMVDGGVSAVARAR